MYCVRVTSYVCIVFDGLNHQHGIRHVDEGYMRIEIKDGFNMF